MTTSDDENIARLREQLIAAETAADGDRYRGQLAFELSRSGRRDEALALRRQTIEIQRQAGAVDPHYLAWLARELEGAGELDEAIGVWSEAATLDPIHLGDLGRLHHQRSEPDAAARAGTQHLLWCCTDGFPGYAADTLDRLIELGPELGAEAARIGRVDGPGRRLIDGSVDGCDDGVRARLLERLVMLQIACGTVADASAATAARLALAEARSDETAEAAATELLARILRRAAVELDAGRLERARGAWQVVGPLWETARASSGVRWSVDGLAQSALTDQRDPSLARTAVERGIDLAQRHGEREMEQALLEKLMPLLAPRLPLAAEVDVGGRARASASPDSAAYVQRSVELVSCLTLRHLDLAVREIELHTKVLVEAGETEQAVTLLGRCSAAVSAATAEEVGSGVLAWLTGTLAPRVCARCTAALESSAAHTAVLESSAAHTARALLEAALETLKMGVIYAEWEAIRRSSDPDTDASALERIARELGEPAATRAEALLREGETDPAEAIVALALELLGQLPNPSWRWSGLKRLGTFATRTLSPARAAPLLAQIGPLWATDPRGADARATTLRDLALALQALDRRDEAITALRDALAAARRSNEPRCLLHSLRALASALRDAGATGEAAALRDESIAPLRAAGPSRRLAGELSGLADDRWRAGEFDAAAAIALELAEMEATLSDPERRAHAWRAAGRYLLDAGRADEAAALFARARKALSGTNWSRWAQLELARAQHAEGRAESAQTLLRELLERADADAEPPEHVVLVALGRISGQDAEIERAKQALAALVERAWDNPERWHWVCSEAVNDHYTQLGLGANAVALARRWVARWDEEIAATVEVQRELPQPERDEILGRHRRRVAALESLATSLERGGDERGAVAAFDGAQRARRRYLQLTALSRWWAGQTAAAR